MNRNVRFWLLLTAALVVVVLIVGGSGGDGPAYDPRSVNPDGARGIVETLERLGARVDLDTSVPTSDSSTALLLQDRLTVEDQQRLADWVRAGGVLVVADPRAPLAARSLGVTQRSGQDRAVLTRDVCTIDVLSETRELVINGSLLDAFGEPSCFGDGTLAFVVAEPVGQGTVVTVGSPDLFTNAVLDDADAAVLAISLLAPDGGDAHVTFVGPSLVEFGEEGLTDLVAPRVTNSILQVLAAFLLYALYRSRRLGGVVPEPVPVRIEGSELVLKAGLLSERSKDPASAAAVLRADVIQRARTTLSIPVGAGHSADPSTLTDHVSRRTDLSSDEVEHAFTSMVSTDMELTHVAQALFEIEHRLYDEHESQTND